MPTPALTAPASLALATGTSWLANPGSATRIPDRPEGDTIDAARSAVRAKARETATEFESSFLSVMLGQMMTDIDGEGPFGSGGAGGVWRSFLGDEYAKSFAKAGGIGLADHVYRALLAQQEAKSA